MKENRYNLSDFDEQEPLSGHHIRFEQKLNRELETKSKQGIGIVRIAAAAVLVFGLSISTYFLTKNNPISSHTASESNTTIPLQQAEFYYQSEFEKQLKSITANFNDAESKEMIKESEILIMALQKDYKQLELELNKTGDYRVATAMILNYKSRISILEKLIEKLQYVNQLKNSNHEKNNA